MATSSVTVLCTLTNSTVTATNFVFPRDWDGHVGDKNYPVMISAANSGQFNHVSGSTGMSQSAVVYTNGDYDWMLSWFSASSGANKVYTEIREAGYFQKADWDSYKAKLEGGSSTSQSSWTKYKASVAITPAGTSPALNGAISLAP
ncbi:hypothetical protein FNV43_RR02647 [Rhamnella rubrinervis]|uniref:Uncharacterized protein n=1 Tax=Rhamnella rubrinervis TaxID=2594499 RepID=A0A8K0MU30_9ROSA|nr:hypothetical protein FNV43_RR02647 [Rhamnella rubrinervis]